MRVLVPFDARDPKRRLAPALDANERRALARAMLTDVIDALDAHDPAVISNAPVEIEVPVTIDERPLTTAVNAELAAETPAAVVMADLPLITSDAVGRLFEPDADVVTAPGLGGGTNALVVRHPSFRVDYHGASIRDHRQAARALDASLATVDSFRLAVDADEPADLAEAVLHGEGAAASWLHDHGGRVVTTDGRVQFEWTKPDTDA